MGKHAGYWGRHALARDSHASFLVAWYPFFQGHYSSDNLWALFGLIVLEPFFAYTVFLKGTSMVGAVKGSLLAFYRAYFRCIFRLYDHERSILCD